MKVCVWWSNRGIYTEISKPEQNYRVNSREWSNFLKKFEPNYFHGKTISGSLVVEESLLDELIDQYPQSLETWFGRK